MEERAEAAEVELGEDDDSLGGVRAEALCPEFDRVEGALGLRSA